MAGNSGLFIVLIIFCIMSIISSILLTYTCTDGTWDFDNFEGEKCIKWPGKEKTDPACNTFTTSLDCPLRCDWNSTNSLCSEPESGGGGGGGGSDPGSSTSPFIASNHSVCRDGLSINESKTSFSANDNSAGVRWFWSAATKYSGCKATIQKYRVTISSSQDNHQQEYYYDVLSGSANSFSFKNAPSTWLSGQNIIFKIIGLTPDNLIVADTITVELDANESTDDGSLVGVGTPVDFTKMTKVIYGGDPPPPRPNPINCSGGSWTNVGMCKIDGVEQNMNECGPPAYQVQVRGGNDFIPAKDGGTCIIRQTVPCATKRDSCEIFDEVEHTRVVDCVQGKWINTSQCSKTCGGGTLTQQRYLIQGDLNGGKKCGAFEQDEKCNTQDCPVDCVGNWSCDPFTEYKTEGICRNGQWNSQTRKKADCTFKVTQGANPYGKPCDFVNGATMIDDQLVKTNTSRCMM